MDAVYRYKIIQTLDAKNLEKVGYGVARIHH